MTRKTTSYLVAFCGVLVVGGAALSLVFARPAGAIPDQPDCIFSECPDLRPQQPAITSGILPSYAAGSVIQVSIYVKNIGDVRATPVSTMEYYFSDDSTLNVQQDTYLGSDNIARLYPNQKQAMSESVTIPSDTPAGTRYLFFVADAEDVVSESDEGNNVTSKSLQVH